MDRVLVLNSSREFLKVCNWKDIIYDVYIGNVTVLENYDRIVRSPSIKLNVPAVVCFNEYINVAYDCLYTLRYCEKNVFARDRYICQYCGVKTEKISYNYIYKKKNFKNINKKRELEHVVPVSRGGGCTWDNTVCSCKYCNNKKGARTPKEAGMELLRDPVKPTKFSEIMRIKLGGQIHELWEKYIF